MWINYRDDWSSCIDSEFSCNMFDVFLVSIRLQGRDITRNFNFRRPSLNNDTKLRIGSPLSLIGMLELLYTENISKVGSMNSSTTRAPATVSLYSHLLGLVIKVNSRSPEHA